MENEQKRKVSDTIQEVPARKIIIDSAAKAEEDALWFAIADELIKESEALEADQRWQQKTKKKDAGQSSKRQR